MAESNPYAAPKAAVEDVQTTPFELATRSQRLLASIADTIVLWVAMMAGAFATGGGVSWAGVGVWVGLGIIGALNLWMVYRYRATIGKKLVKIRMVRPDGSEAPMWRLVFLRSLPQWVVGSIPLVNILALVDILWIFGRAHRCVHDYIGGTIVVTAK